MNVKIVDLDVLIREYQVKFRGTVHVVDVMGITQFAELISVFQAWKGNLGDLEGLKKLMALVREYVPTFTDDDERRISTAQLIKLVESIIEMQVVGTEEEGKSDSPLPVKRAKKPKMSPST